MVARYGGRRRRRESFYHTNGGIKVRSKFERTVINDLESRGIEFGYETLELPWLDTVANGECGDCGSEEVGKHCVYTPDVIFPSGSIVEIKGLFTARDRKIAVGVRKAHPELTIRFLFMQDKWMTKKKVRRYSDWATKNGFESHTGTAVPQEWI